LLRYFFKLSIQQRIDGYIITFEVLTAVIRKIYIFWNTTPRGPLKVRLRFGGRSASYVIPAGFLLASFFEPEDGGEIYLQDIG
jgi:hypothetical protein